VRAFWALAAVVLAIGLVRLYRPFGAIGEQSLRIAQLRAAKANLLAQQAGLESERGFLATDAGQEAAARRTGYVRPGERRLVFVPAGDARPAGDVKSDRARSPRQSTTNR
jgi:cell division protein FtsB